MARGKGLSVARERLETERDLPVTGEPAQATAMPDNVPKTARLRPNAGKMHIGGYYDPDDKVIDAFRRLAFETRRSQQELLREAMIALLSQQAGEATFAPNTTR